MDDILTKMARAYRCTLIHRERLETYFPNDAYDMTEVRKSIDKADLKWKKWLTFLEVYGEGE